MSGPNSKSSSYTDKKNSLGSINSNSAAASSSILHQQEEDIYENRSSNVENTRSSGVLLLGSASYMQPTNSDANAAVSGIGSNSRQHEVTKSKSNASFTSDTYSSSSSRHSTRRTFSRFILRFICCFHVSRFRGTSPLLDMAAMMKSLLAAISILTFLREDTLLGGYDYLFQIPCGGYSCPWITIPSWMLKEQCRPALELGNQIFIFKVFLVCNQLVFATTSFLIHVNPYKILQHPNIRVFLAFFFGLCSFVFGFCKLVIVISIPATASISFECIQHHADMIGERCDDVSAVIPGSYFHIQNLVLPSCHDRFFISLPNEVYLLSMTFVLTFLYSLFMCDSMLHHGEMEALEASKGASNSNQNEDEVNEEQDDENSANDDEDVSDGNHKLPPAADDNSTSTALLTPQPASQKQLVNGVDVMFEHERAVRAAKALSAQELLVCQIASAHKNQLQSQMKSHQYTYRMVRDIATFFKFLVTIVSLCMLLYGVTSTIISCDRNQQPQDIVVGVTTSSIKERCTPALQMDTDGFYFASAGMFVAVVFIVIIIIEKKVVAPRHSKFISFVCLGVVIFLLAVQFSLMFDIEKMPLTYPCPFLEQVTYDNQTLSASEKAVCNQLQVNVTAITPGTLKRVYEIIECTERCYVQLGLSSYTLFASLVLTLVYMASLTWQYHRLAKAVLRSQSTVERAHQLGRDGSVDDNETAKGIVMDIMSKS